MYSKTCLALQYPNGKLVAVDHSSGGYCYEADDIREVWFADRDKLEQYRKAGSEGLKIVSVVVSVEIK